MARRSFDVVDLMELFVHWEADRAESESGPEDGAEVFGAGGR